MSNSVTVAWFLVFRCTDWWDLFFLC
jgi:hypothetical protein